MDFVSWNFEIIVIVFSRRFLSHPTRGPATFPFSCTTVVGSKIAARTYMFDLEIKYSQTRFFTKKLNKNSS